MVFKKLAKTLSAAAVCFCLVLAFLNNSGGFFEKLSVIAAAVAMPEGSVSVAAEYLKGSNSQNTSSQSIDTQSQTAVDSIVSQGVSSAVESQVVLEQKPTEMPSNAGEISEYAIIPSKTSQKIIWHDGAAFSNTSKFSNAEILKVLKQSPNIKAADGKPQVLIFHTHATESYELEDLGYYIKGSSARTTDEKYNMLRVGDEIVKQLEEAGIGVIHDRQLYDHPSYNGAYNRSAETIKKYLKKYPSISVVLDIHRDAIGNDVRVKPTAVINGKKAAQIMIISGVDDGTMNFPNWRENLKFASALQTRMEKDYAGLTRAVMVCHRRYNMYLSNNSLLIEMGGHANTLDEAIYSGEMLGKSLVKVIKEQGKG